MFVIYWEQFNVQSVMFIFVCLQDLLTSLDVNLASFNFRRNFVTILHVYHNVSLCFNQNPIIIIMFYDGDDDDDYDDDDGSMRYLVRHCEPAKTNIMLFHSSSGVQLTSRWWSNVSFSFHEVKIRITGNVWFKKHQHVYVCVCVCLFTLSSVKINCLFI